MLDASKSVDLDTNSNSGLMFAWSCTPLSISNSYICTGFPNNIRDSSILFKSGTMSVGFYNITVKVSNSAGLYSYRSIMIKITSQQLASIDIVATQVVYNPSDKVTLQANIFNVLSNSTSIWSINNDATLMNNNNLTSAVVLLSAGRNFISLAMKPYSFTGGLSYSFILSVINNFGSIVSNSLVIKINQCPRYGTLSVAPSFGIVSTTIFYLQASQWLDDPSDYPLNYVFSYYQTNSANQYVIKFKSLLSYTSTFLGQGSAFLNYVVNCLAIISDIHDCRTNTSTTVQVYPFSNSISPITYSTNVLRNVLNTSNPTLVNQIVASSLTTVNSISCDISPSCRIIYNRQDCGSFSNTCGECLTGN